MMNLLYTSGKSFFAFLLIQIFCISIVFSQTTQFNNAGGDQFFFNASNWDNGLPAAGGIAVIPVGFSAVVNLSADQTADYDLQVEGSLEINPSTFTWTLNKGIQVTGAFTNSCNLELKANSLFDGTITNTGNGLMHNHAQITFSGNLTNGGNLHNLSIGSVDASGYLLQIGAGVLNNEGNYTNMAGGILESFNAINNMANLWNDGVITSAGPFNNQGTISNQATFNNNNDLVNEGSLTNQGTFSSTFSLTNKSILLNEGIAQFYGTNVNEGQIFNDGELQIISGSFSCKPGASILNMGQFDLFSGLDNEGTFISQPCATFRGQENSSLLNSNGGVFSNNGIAYAFNGANIEFTAQNGLLITDPLATPAPTANCVPSLTYTLSGTTPITLNMNDFDAGSSSNYCLPMTRSLSKSTLTCADKGISLVYLEVKDGNGNAANCFTTVTLLDVQKPDIQCPNNITVTPTEPVCAVMVEFEVMASDECGVPDIIPQGFDPLVSGDMFPVGTTELTYWANDGQNIDSCSFTITVDEQLLGLTLDCKTSISVIVDENCERFITPDDVLLSPFGCADNLVIGIEGIPGYDQVVGANVGTTLNAQLQYGSSGPICLFTIEVDDSEAPLLICDTVVWPCTADLTSVPQPLASDCALTLDFDYTETVLSTSNCTNGYAALLQRNYVVSDLSGNTATCQQIVALTNAVQNDITYPAAISFSCNTDYEADAFGNPAPSTWPNAATGAPGSPMLAGVPMYGTANNSFCEVTATYADAIAQGSCAGSKLINRTWSITDNCAGLTYTGLQQITIVDDAAPMLVCPPNTIKSTNEGCLYTAFLPVPSASDVCGGTLSYLADDDQGYVADFKILHAPEGDYLVTWTATDNCGNSATCSHIITVHDGVNPVIVLNGNNAFPPGNISPSDLLTSVSDNCTQNPPVEIAILNPNGTSTFGAGVVLPSDQDSVSVIIKVVDESGNITLDTIVIQITSMVPVNATLICPADVTLTTADLSSLSNPNSFGQPFVLNPSGNTLSGINNVVLPNYNACQGGTMERIFSMTDLTTGIISYCIQKIFILPNTEYEVTFPADQLIGVECALGDNVTFPIVTGNSQHVVVSFTDSLGTAPCPSIYRHWVVKDTCAYQAGALSNTVGGILVEGTTYADNGDGYFRYTQVLEINDQLAPEIDANCGSMMVNVAENCLAVFDVTVGVNDNCSAAINCQITFPDFPLLSVSTIGQGGVATYTLTLTKGNYNAVFTATDACGNSSTCNGSITVSDPGGFCGGGIIDEPVSGFIMSPTQSVMEGLALTAKVQNTAFAAAQTDANGAFTFESLPNGEVITIQPVWSSNYVSQLNIADLVAQSKLQTQASTTPWQLMAADMNYDQQINSLDQQQLINTILGKQNADRFTLIPSTTQVDNQTALSIPQTKSVNCVAGDELAITAFLPGDLNFDVLQTQPTLDYQQVYINPPTSVVPNAIFPVHIAIQSDQLEALQLGLQWNEGMAEFIGIQSEQLSNLSAKNTYQPDETHLHIVWQGAPIQTSKDEVLLTLYFSAISEKPAFGLTQSTTSMLSMIYANQSLTSLTQEAAEGPELTTPILYPNPTTKDLYLSIAPQQAGTMNVTAYDVAGRAIDKLQFNTTEGPQVLQLDAANWPVGALYLRISTVEKTWVMPVLKK